MAWTEEMTVFLVDLSGKSDLRKAFEAQQTKKRNAVDTTMARLEGKKESMRAAMADLPKLDDPKTDPQEQRRILAQVTQAYEAVNEMLEELKNAKGEDGEALFTDAQQLADELFTPLIREGLLVDDLVAGEYSEVQKLLDNSFKAYKATLEEARAEKEKTKAEKERSKIETTATILEGGVSWTDRPKAVGAYAWQKISYAKDDMVGDLKDWAMQGVNSGIQKVSGKSVMGTKEERARAFTLVTETYTAYSSVQSAFTSVENLQSGKGATDAAKFLSENAKNEQSKAEVSSLCIGFAEKIDAFFGLDSPEASNLKRKIGEIITEVAERLDEGVTLAKEAKAAVENFMKSGEYKAMMQVKDLGSGVSSDVSGVKDIAKFGEEVVGKATFEHELRKGAADLVVRLDHALQSVVGKVHAVAAVALDGGYLQAVKTGAVVAAATADPDPESQTIIDLLAAGFAPAFASCAPDEAVDAFKRIGTQIGASFKSTAKASTLTEALKKDPQTGFSMLIPLVEKAASKSLGLLGESDRSDDPEAAQHFKDALGKGKTREAMLKKATSGDEEVLLEQMERSDEEIAEYERQLVLVDEGGTLMANMKSIESLINELKRDQKILQLAAGISGQLSSVTSGTMDTVVAFGGTISNELMGEIAGPLKAAKLVTQLAVNIVNAAKRWQLWYKFRTDLERAKKAVSALSPVIQGFYDNKKEQVAFHTIEDALLAVQLAGAVLGSIPEPITLATGKTLSAVSSAAAAANKVAGLIYSEAILRQGWAATKAFLDDSTDREAGNKALQLNSTLAMHAIAWAGMEKRDPIARMVLDSCGLSEQTLAVAGPGGEKKVREYLETLLPEDRKFMDIEQVKASWQPKQLTLTSKDWIIVQLRAAKDAVPPLSRDGADDQVIAALRQIDAQGELKTLMTQAKGGTLETVALDENVMQTEGLIRVLNDYKPRSSNGKLHEEMSEIVQQFLTMSDGHRLELTRIRDVNTNAKDVG